MDAPSPHNGFPYSSVLRILAQMFDAEKPKALAKLKARIRKLQSEGLPLGDRPGRGEKSAYSLEQVVQMVLFLELAEIGLPPSLVSKLATDIDFVDRQDEFYTGSKLKDIIEKIKEVIDSDENRKSHGKFSLEISPFAMTCSWIDYDGHSCKSRLLDADVDHHSQRNRRQIVLGLNQIGSDLRHAIQSERGRP